MEDGRSVKFGVVISCSSNRKKNHTARMLFFFSKVILKKEIGCEEFEFSGV